MKNFDQMDQLLKQALSPSVEPSKDLNQKIISKFKEDNIMRPVRKNRMSVALIAATLTLIMSITALAAWNFLQPKQVAEHFGDEGLANAFEDKRAIELNESVVSGGYNFTLLGIVSGEGLSDFESSAQEIHPDRTYAVVSIVKEDGSNMPEIQDEEYGQVRFFISPLVKGQKPWLVNIASMNGGYVESVIDGVMYRLIECDGVEMFADRGLYLCISTSDFYDINAFNYDEETGEVSPNTDYNGANALFNLPLDITKADHEKAEKYLKELLGEPESDSTDSKEPEIDWEKEFEDGVIIPESIKEVIYDENGLACYEYEDYNISVNIEELFEKEETEVSKIVSIFEEDGEKPTAIQLSRDVNGVITGRVLKLK
ncbi:hypothetical protein [Proteiniborus sp. MB09-C3]|uniref:hypothetical protein n=1 Tax=Proteiniborus sp. MB09-C3 TaxID=3050072 RepID=UPI002554774B|nr:hypothetical protein [Proteiniborus sp. MB09-C3]WIV12401.1 hypothetical protein QO263_01350 [Proteiniborus sp. MB09-C3]